MTVRIPFLSAVASTLILSASLAAAQAPTPAPLPDAPSASPQLAPAPVPTGPTAVIDTTMGRLTCKLFSQQSPVASANFIGLSEGTKPWTDPVTQQKVTGKSFYEGTTFHRVIPGFMIQGGDRKGDGSGDAGYYFDNEDTPTLKFDTPGRLAMANAGANTNGTQFFITEQATPQLDGGYTIFGQCDEHTVLLVSSIARVPRNAEDKPDTPVVISRITIVRDGQPMPPQPAGTPQAPTSSSPMPASLPKGAIPQ